MTKTWRLTFWNTCILYVQNSLGCNGIPCDFSAEIVPPIYECSVGIIPIQYEHAPLRVRCAMLRKHPPVYPVLSCLSCFQKPSVGVCQVVSNSPDPGIASLNIKNLVGTLATGRSKMVAIYPTCLPFYSTLFKRIRVAQFYYLKCRFLCFGHAVSNFDH